MQRVYSDWLIPNTCGHNAFAINAETPAAFRIQLAVDGSEHSLAATQLVRDLQLPPNSEITILGVLTPGRPPSKSRLQSAFAHAEKFLEGSAVEDARWPVLVMRIPYRELRRVLLATDGSVPLPGQTELQVLHVKSIYSSKSVHEYYGELPPPIPFMPSIMSGPAELQHLSHVLLDRGLLLFVRAQRKY